MVLCYTCTLNLLTEIGLVYFDSSRIPLVDKKVLKKSSL